MNGVNIVDTSPNLESLEAERTLGQAIDESIRDGVIRRDQIVVVDRAGIVSKNLIALLNTGKAKDKVFLK